MEELRSTSVFSMAVPQHRLHYPKHVSEKSKVRQVKASAEVWLLSVESEEEMEG